MSLPSMLPLSVCVRERGRGADRVGRRGGGGGDYRRTPARVTLRNSTLKTNTHTHTKSCFLVGCWLFGITEGRKKKLKVWHLYFERPFTPHAHFFPLYLSWAALFPSLSAGNCSFNKMPGQSCSPMLREANLAARGGPDRK